MRIMLVYVTRMRPEEAAERQNSVAARGYALESLSLPASIRECVQARNWIGLDQAVRLETNPGGSIFETLCAYEQFTEIEFIISIRPSPNHPGEPDEDGIWHDDGSRILAFSLSLSLEHGAIEGGRLGLRRRGTEETLTLIPTPPFGTLIVFATGHQGYEHRIHRVTAGERIIIAGWCT